MYLWTMKTIGNILWVVFGGLIIAILYYIFGLLLCITIIGIPFGIQLFKLGTYALWPFGHELVYRPQEPGCLTLFMDIVWIMLGWWEIALLHVAFGILFCITIIGIPLGVQHFKLAFATLIPYGKEIR